MWGDTEESALEIPGQLRDEMHPPPCPWERGSRGRSGSGSRWQLALRGLRKVGCSCPAWEASDSDGKLRQGFFLVLRLAFQDQTRDPGIRERRRRRRLRLAQAAKDDFAKGSPSKRLFGKAGLACVWAASRHRGLCQVPPGSLLSVRLQPLPPSWLRSAVPGSPGLGEGRRRGSEGRAGHCDSRAASTHLDGGLTPGTACPRPLSVWRRVLASPGGCVRSRLPHGCCRPAPVCPQGETRSPCWQNSLPDGEAIKQLEHRICSLGPRGLGSGG